MYPRKQLALLSLLALFGCSILEPSAPRSEVEIPYRVEAEQVALFYSGELYPPEDLTRRVSRELEILRTTFGDSIPEVHIKFQLPWQAGLLKFAVDGSTYTSIADSTNLDWTSLCDSIGVTYFSSMGRYLRVYSEKQFHPQRMGNFFEGFLGVARIQSSEFLHPYRPHYVRVEELGVTKYFFQLGDLINYDWRYFVVNDGVAILIDQIEWLEGIHDSIFTMEPNRSYDYIQDYTDSVEANRPAWVDTARGLEYDLHHNHHYWWTAPE